jgi:creatinine amidohydrolase
MTWHEIEKHLKNVNDNIIISVGTCEQHGYHLPLGTDIFIAEYFADILSEKTGAIVAPTLNYGVNLPCDIHFAGTTSISAEILRETILSIINWWEQQGVVHFAILTCHGDPFHLQALQIKADNIKLIDISDIDYSDILEKQATIRHACEAETSIVLQLFPEKVKADKIQEFDIDSNNFKKYLFHEDKGMPKGYVGSLGFPSFGTKEKGICIVNSMIDKTINEGVEFLKASTKLADRQISTEK